MQEEWFDLLSGCSRILDLTDRLQKVVAKVQFAYVLFESQKDSVMDRIKDYPRTESSRISSCIGRACCDGAENVNNLVEAHRNDGVEDIVKEDPFG